MSRGFGARESSRLYAGDATASQQAAAKISEKIYEVDRQASESRGPFEAAFAAKKEANKEHDEARTNLATYKYELLKAAEAEVKSRMSEEEFNDLEGQPKRDEDGFLSPTRGEKAVKELLKDKLNSDPKVKKLEEEQDASRNKLDSASEVSDQAGKKYRIAEKKANKYMLELMEAVGGDKPVADKGEVGDGKPGNGVKEADGKVRLRLEDLAYMLGATRSAFDEVGPDEGSNEALVMLQTRSSKGPEIELNFSYSAEKEESDETFVRGYTRDGFNIEEKGTVSRIAVEDASVDIDNLRSYISKSGFVVSDSDFDRFVSSAEHGIVKFAPEGDWEEEESY